MSMTATIHPSPFRSVMKILGWLLRFTVLVVLYFVLFSISGQIVGPYLPNITAKPDPLPLMTALLLSSMATAAVIMLTIHSSRWHGWKLILSMSVAYYLVLIIVTQLEAWYFLYGITVGPELMKRLFLQGIPVAFFFIPIAVLVMGRLRASENEIHCTRNRSDGTQRLAVETECHLYRLSGCILSRWIFHRLAKPGCARLLRFTR